MLKLVVEQTPVQRAVGASLAVKGAKPYNMMPANIRNIDSRKINDSKENWTFFKTKQP